jgi:hypothetical protein
MKPHSAAINFIAVTKSNRGGFIIKLNSTNNNRGIKMINKQEIKQDMIEQLQEALYGLGYKGMFEDEEAIKKIKELVWQAQVLIEELE